MIKDHFILAIKNLRTRGLRSYLTMLGIFLGIAAVVSLISLGQGLQEAITGQFSTLDADKLLVQNIGTGFGPPGSTAVKKLTEHDLKLIKSINNVEFAIPRLIRVVEVEFNKISQFRNVASMPPEKEQIVIIYDVFNAAIDEGRLLIEKDRKKVILGNNFKEGSDNGFDKKIQVGTTLKIQKEEFEVTGILKESSSFIINNAILMPESDLERILNIEDEIDVIAIQVENEDVTEKVAEDIERVLRKNRKQKLGEEDFSVQTPLQTISTVNTIFNIINLVVGGIAGISLLVGGIGIANTMYTSVLERTKEIGIMKSIGAKNSDILKIFLIESALLGIIGGIIGVLIGLALAFAASNAASNALGGIAFKVTFSPPLIFAAIFFSLLIGMLSGILPAIQASKLNPVEALRQWFKNIQKWQWKL